MTKPARPLTRKAAAEQSGLSVTTIDRMIADGVLMARKFKRAVRIDGAAFERYMQSVTIRRGP